MIGIQVEVVLHFIYGQTSSFQRGDHQGKYTQVMLRCKPEPSVNGIYPPWGYGNKSRIGLDCQVEPGKIELLRLDLVILLNHT